MQTRRPFVIGLKALRPDIDDLTHIVQRISKQLRPPLLDTVGLSAAVEWERREFTEWAGLKATTAIDVVDPRASIPTARWPSFVCGRRD